MNKILLSILLVCSVQSSFASFFGKFFYSGPDLYQQQVEEERLFKNLSKKQIKLIKAVQKSNIGDVRKLLIDNNINLKDADGRTLLMIAVESGNTEIVRLLIKSGAKVNAKNKEGYTVLMHARNDAIVKLLISSGADLHSTHDIFYYEYGGCYGSTRKKQFIKGTELMMAASCGYTNKVKILICARADVNARDKYGKTALMHAAQNGRVGVAQVLLDAGADINAKDTYGETVLMHGASCESGNTKIVDLLIAAGADVNAKNNIGETYHSLALTNIIPRWERIKD
jgi:ankyrin repeat protein